MDKVVLIEVQRAEKRERGARKKINKKRVKKYDFLKTECKEGNQESKEKICT